MKLIAHTLHFIHQPGNLVIEASSHLLTRSSHLVREPGDLVVQAPSHRVELGAHLRLGAAIAHPIGALQWR
jgi:hypothetical protein